MIVAIALAIGGIVLSGSSRASTDEFERSLRQAEAARNSAIDALELVELRGQASVDLPPDANHKLLK